MAPSIAEARYLRWIRRCKANRHSFEGLRSILQGRLWPSVSCHRSMDTEFRWQSIWHIWVGLHSQQCSSTWRRQWEWMCRTSAWRIRASDGSFRICPTWTGSLAAWRQSRRSPALLYLHTETSGRCRRCGIQLTHPSSLSWTWKPGRASWSSTLF